MRLLRSYLALLLVPFLFSNCFSLIGLNSRVELIPDHSKTKVSILTYEGYETIRPRDLDAYKLRNDGKIVFLKLERENAISMVYPLEPTRFNFYKLSDFGVMVAGTSTFYLIDNEKDRTTFFKFALVSIGSWYAAYSPDVPWRRFNKSYKLPPLRTYPIRSETDQLLALSTVDIELGEGDLTTQYFSSYSAYNRDRPATSKNSTEEIRVKQTMFMEDLRLRLGRSGFVDTSGKVFASRFVPYTLSAELVEAKTKIVEAVVQVEGKVRWRLTDEVTGKELHSAVIEEASSFVAFDMQGVSMDGSMTRALASLFEVSMVEFLKQGPTRRILSKESTSLQELQDSWETLSIVQGPDSITSIGKATQSVVTISDKQGHGSGLVIGSEGYIITNHHVVANALAENTPMKVHFSDGSIVPCEIIRHNPEYDLALIKVDRRGLHSFYTLPRKAIEVGTDVYAIGTPGSIDLGQTISKGIISGKRVDEGKVTIQSDVSVNGGNSGGPLLYRNGKLIGVVNAKIVGLGVEGISFAIPAGDIESALKIQLIRD